MLHKLSFKISSKPIKNLYVKDIGKKYCKITPCELTKGKLIIHILHIYYNTHSGGVSLQLTKEK